MLAITAAWWEKVVLETERVGSRGVAFCILLWFGMGCDCHALMDPMHPTAVAAGGQ